MSPVLVRIPLLAGLVVTAACSGGDGGGVTTPPTASTGTVSGAITAAGAGVGGATIALSAGGSQTSDGNGRYTFSSVAAGSHTLTLTVPSGFGLAAGENATKPVTVAANQTATINWSLQQVTQGARTADTVRLGNTDFSPQTLTIPAGRTVVWINEQAMFHTITPDRNTVIPRVETSTAGQALSVTFTTPGTYNYFCEPHRAAGMRGSIVVQ